MSKSIHVRQSYGKPKVGRFLRHGVVYYTANFPPMTLAVFDVRGCVAETGSGNKLPLVAFESTPLEQPPACCIVVLDY